MRYLLLLFVLSACTSTPKEEETAVARQSVSEMPLSKPKLPNTKPFNYCCFPTDE